MLSLSFQRGRRGRRVDDSVVVRRRRENRSWRKRSGGQCRGRIRINGRNEGWKISCRPFVRGFLSRFPAPEHEKPAQQNNMDGQNGEDGDSDMRAAAVVREGALRDQW